MCGIAGFFETQKISDNALIIVKKMAQTLASRGPDYADEWHHPQAGVTLAHTRLSILDLSVAGAQPMVSPSGRFTIVYNGEIYNFKQVKAELAELGVDFNNKTWRGENDTQIMLSAFEQWGIETAIIKLNGMFAFAVWDDQLQQLILGRDRIGKKPLYYGFLNDTWFFASQPKAILEHPNFEKKPNVKALRAYLNYGYVPDNMCAFEHLGKVEPGYLIYLDKNGTSRKQCFWSLHKVINRQRSLPGALPKNANNSLVDWVSESEKVIDLAVEQRMQSDVPFGAFLSGGIDSSLIVAIMQKHSTSPIKTFTIGFESIKYNEAHHAKAIAKHLKTEHYEHYFPVESLLDLVHQLPHWYDEPFADSSSLPTYLLCKTAREHVTVALSGDGGDEVFGGYKRYFVARNLKTLSNNPLFKNFAKMMLKLQAAMPTFTNSVWRIINILPFTPANLANKATKLFGLLTFDNLDQWYAYLMQYWSIDKLKFEWHPQLEDVAEQFQYMDSISYLPGDILTKVDRASMALSLEARSPLLDTQVIEHAWQLPIEAKFGRPKYWQSNGKIVLKQILEKYVPNEMFNRQKMGFGVPINEWLRGPLKNWGHEHLQKLAQSPMLNDLGLSSDMINNSWQEFQGGSQNNGANLWVLIILQQWYQHYFE